MKVVPIPRYESCYKVSDTGEVFSVKRRKRLNPQINNSGHYVVCFIRDGIREWRMVHKLVAEAFNGLPPDADYECFHVDGDKSNNVPSNLIWCTRKERIDRTKSLEYKRMLDDIRGVDRKMTNANKVSVRVNGVLYDSILEACFEFGVSSRTIGRCLRHDRPTKSGIYFERV